MKRIETNFIFDMDGTLVDNMKYHFQAWNAFFVEMGKDVPVMELIPKISGKPSEEAIKLTLGDGIPSYRVQEFVDRKEEIYRQIYSRWLKPIPGLVDFLGKSQSIGISLAVATSAPRINIDFTIDGLDIRKYFDVIVGSEGLTNGKPDPEIFLTTAKRLNSLPEKCIVFEDSIIGIDAASRAGMKIVVVTTTLDGKEYRNNPSVLGIIDNFNNLDPAAFLVN
jgi:HAD superfamily hydrolase (TIGR01509 family)